MVHGVRQLIVAVGCALATLALGLVFAGDHTPGAVDDAARSAVDGWPPGVLHALVLPTEPYILLPAAALLAAWRLRASALRDAVFVVLAPSLAVAANTWLLKPLFDRWKGDTLVYPSGHTVSLVALLVVVLVLVHGRARTIVAIVAVAGAVLLACAAAGMVGLGYHYVTDIAGGAFFATFTVLAVRGLVPPHHDRAVAGDRGARATPAPRCPPRRPRGSR